MFRVASCPTSCAPVDSPAAWVARVNAQVRCAADAGAQLAVLAEYVASALLTLDNRWQAWNGLWHETIAAAARSTGIAVCGGTWPVSDQGRLVNRAVMALPDGSTWHQDKLHPTPWERTWGLAATDAIGVHTVGGVRLAVLTCYDIEFPEACRAAARSGAEVLLVPSWTDDRQGFHRVRHCAAARCIENGVFVVHAPLVGFLPGVPGFEQAVGSAGILTPCDTGFSGDGIAAAGGWNQPEVILADLDLDRLRAIRTSGTVTPLADARPASGYRCQADQPPT